MVPDTSGHGPRMGLAETLWRKDAPREGQATLGLDSPSPACSTPLAPPCPATCWSPSGAGKSLFSEYTVRFFKVFDPLGWGK